MLTIDGALKDFYAKMGRINAGCIVIFAQSDILDPTQATLGVGSNAPPVAAMSIFRQLLRPTDQTIEVLANILLADKKIEDLTPEEQTQLQQSVHNILNLLLPTLALAGLRQEDQRMIKPASSLITL